MTGAHTESLKRIVDLRAIPTPGAWEALLLPVAGLPVPPEDRECVRGAVKKFVTAAKTSLHLSSEVFVQVEQSDDAEARALYNRHAREWIPEVGLGVWPDREPPRVWTKEEFMSVVPGEKLRPLMFQVFRITDSERAKEAARNVMLGFGPVIEILIQTDGDSFLDRCTSVLLPPIKDPSFTCFPFYIPLLEAQNADLRNFGTDGRMVLWRIALHP